LGLFIIDYDGFAVPTGYVGTAPGAGHFVMVAAAASDRNTGEIRDLFCTTAPRFRSTVVDGRRAQAVTCPQEGDADTSGHLLLYWTAHGTLAAVSLHGFSETNFQVARAVASRVRWITPGR